MVSYCCVKDCRNNSAEKWRGSNAMYTFHVFPMNPEAKQKWLKAIGRPTWDPPNHARICSVHFSDDQINKENQRTRLKEDACPVRELPAESYFEATDLVVCRICLVMDVKMYSLQDQVLKICIKSITGLSKEMEGLPQYVCYECAFQLLKCYKLIEKSNISKATLLNIFSQNGEVTKNLVKKVNRTHLDLKSSLTFNTVVPKTVIDFQYDEDLNKYIHSSKTEEYSKEENETMEVDSYLKRLRTKTNDPKRKDKKLRCSYEHELDNKKSNKTKLRPYKRDAEHNLSDYKLKSVTGLEEELDDYKLEKNYSETIKGSDNFVNVNSVIKKDPGDTDSEFNVDDEDEIKMDESYESFEENEPLKNLKKPRKKCKKNPAGLTPDEVEMQKYFDVVILSLEEQIEDREKMKESAAFRDALYKCDICYKTYLHPNAYKMHLENHDPSRGKAECPVCKLRYKNEVLARSHANRTHGKKFFCKSCPKVFNNVRIAKKHEKRHSGYVYSCSQCAFTSPHESAYSTHVRTRHPAAYSTHVCARCGLQCHTEGGLRRHQLRVHGGGGGEQPTVIDDASMFPCKDCDTRFTTDDALRNHMLTSHQNNQNREERAASLCLQCGLQLPTPAQLQQHISDTHTLTHAHTQRHTQILTGDVYPAPCNICGEILNNRKEHYFHVRKMHPKQRESYQPVITAVCDTCGKGFQNSTKLHLHELRHTGVGTVRCPHCPRLFYDKYQLARHIGVHSDARPFACRLCDKAFKLRSNLDRHAKVHSGATPYECTMCGKRFRYSSSRNLHVRTVHYKLPHPPRKRTSKTARTATYDS